MSVRKELAEILAFEWAEVPTLSDLRVLATERELDDISTPTALIRLRTVGKAPAAPNSHRTVGVLLTLISPHADLDRAADELDAVLDAALNYLDIHYQHEEATLVGYNDRLAFDIPISILASKE